MNSAGSLSHDMHAGDTGFDRSLHCNWYKFERGKGIDIYADTSREVPLQRSFAGFVFPTSKRYVERDEKGHRHPPFIIP